MAEYGNGLSLGDVAELDKQRVYHALCGELLAGEDEHGFVYTQASKEECDAYILSVVDHWYFEAKRLADSGRAMERVMAAHGWTIPLNEYMEAMSIASREYADYLYEDDKAELNEIINEIESGCR